MTLRGYKYIKDTVLPVIQVRTFDGEEHQRLAQRPPTSDAEGVETLAYIKDTVLPVIQLCTFVGEEHQQRLEIAL